MDGLCKEGPKERQMEKDSSEYLICIRKVPKSGTNEASFGGFFYLFFLSITGGGREDAFRVCAQCNHRISIVDCY